MSDSISDDSGSCIQAPHLLTHRSGVSPSCSNFSPEPLIASTIISLCPVKGFLLNEIPEYTGFTIDCIITAILIWSVFILFFLKYSSMVGDVADCHINSMELKILSDPPTFKIVLNCPAKVLFALSSIFAEERTA